MRPRAIVIAILGVVLVILSAAQQGARPAPAAAPPCEAACELALTAADVTAMQSDLARMQSLLDQMERNLAFVSNGQTPLKHQFELEVEMWRMLTQQMQQRLRKAESNAKLKMQNAK